MGEEAFVACTQVVQPSFAIRRIMEAILRAPTMAHVQNIARLTIAGQGVQFRLPKRPLRSTFQKINQWNLLNIPQPVFGVDEVVA